MISIKTDLFKVPEKFSAFNGRSRAAELDRSLWRLLASVIRVGRPVELKEGTSLEPVASGIPASLLKAEIEVLPEAQRLIGSGNFLVVYARAAQIPWCLQEIGRLREMTFRAAGEGTGRSSDIDLYDAYYLHLFVWDAKTEMIVGAYRMGLADEISSRYGKTGLYTQTLFSYGNRVLSRLNPAIELGRSFVRAEYQRNFSPLMLMWRGICQFILRSPRYAILFGPVSISNAYAPLSREMMVEYLSTNNVEPSVARHVKARRPFRVRRQGVWNERGLASVRDIEELSRVIERIEDDNKGVPVLLRQYLKLGGRLLGFSSDNAFSDALDGLIMVDLRDSDPRVLGRYMGESGLAEFQAFHGIDPHSRELARMPGSARKA